MVSEFNAGFEEHGIGVSHFMPELDGVYIKAVDIPAGKQLSMHTHTFTHKSVLANGLARLRVGQDVSVIAGPRVLQIESGKEHSVEAITPCVWLCIHATSETDPDRIDHTLVREN